jgi:nucleotide-binding universal stress UspA family protein
VTESARAHVVLVPVDFSEHSRTALRRAMHMARMLGHDVALLHVIDTTSFLDKTKEAGAVATALRDEARKQLAALAAEADPERRTIKITEVLEGRPWTVILHVAESLSPQLIVVGKRGEGPVSIGVGSVAERVVRSATCDVLVVREREAPAPDPVPREE